MHYHEELVQHTGRGRLAGGMVLLLLVLLVLSEMWVRGMF